MDKWTKVDAETGKSELQKSTRNQLVPETNPSKIMDFHNDTFRQTAEYNTVDRFNYDEQFWNFLPFHTLFSTLSQISRGCLPIGKQVVNNFHTKENVHLQLEAKLEPDEQKEEDLRQEKRDAAEAL